jgi:hypothetical protein
MPSSVFALVFLRYPRHVGFGIDRRARSRKARGGIRSLLGKPPDGKEVGERLARLAPRMFKGGVTDATAKRITLSLHPAAAPVRIAVLPDGELEVTGETASVGPAYHADVIARMAPLFEELEYAWTSDEPDPKSAMLEWLARELAAGATRIGMPERIFKIDAAVQTPMGPRDRAWVDAVIADPARGADAFAWVDDGPGRRDLSRALLAMWHEVPWREPVDDAERALLERVDKALSAARKADPSLELPWAEWAELLMFSGQQVDKDIRTRAGDREPTIGYRRYPMEVELSGGWSIELGGAFVGHWEDDDSRWWATDGDRVVEFSSLTAGDETDSAKLLAVAPERYPVIERITEDARHGRAEAYDDEAVHIVTGLMAAAPNVAIMTCKGNVEDEAWALATWRSLRWR